MDKKIDETDLELLKLLEKNAKMRIHTISRKMGMPASTIHHRIRKLEEDGLISGYTIRKNYPLLGLGMKAHVLVFVDIAMLKKMKRTQRDVASDIRNLDAVQSVDIVTGDADLLVTVRAKDMEAFQTILLEKLQSIEGITKTKTMIVVSES